MCFLHGKTEECDAGSVIGGRVKPKSTGLLKNIQGEYYGTVQKTRKEDKTQKGSATIGAVPKNKKIVKSMGFKKLNSSVILPDNAATRGQIRLISHMVKVEELD